MELKDLCPQRQFYITELWGLSMNQESCGLYCQYSWQSSRLLPQGEDSRVAVNLRENLKSSAKYRDNSILDDIINT